MNNDKLSKIPVSELTPENLNSLKKQGSVSLPGVIKKRKDPKKLALLIAGILLSIGIGVALFFIFRKPAEVPDSTDQTHEEIEPVWQPSDESENPSAEYVDHQQSIIDDPSKTSTEKLKAELAIINHFVVLEDYAEAESRLDSIQREGRSNRELFYIYSGYCNLYKESGNKESSDKYEALLDEVLSRNWDDEEEVNTQGE